jgi:hypothetical protein
MSLKGEKTWNGNMTWNPFPWFSFFQ